VIVSCIEASFLGVIEHLKGIPLLSIDTETTGTRTYHGDEIFALIISTGTKTFYFNFNHNRMHDGSTAPVETRLYRSHIELLRPLFEDPNRIWFAHKAQFEMHGLSRWGIEIKGVVHCTKAIRRVDYNHYFDHGSLSDSVKEIGGTKDDGVMNYIKEHKLKTVVDDVEYLHFDKVPLSVMVPYAEMDALLCYKLGVFQLDNIAKQDADQAQIAPRRSVRNVLDNERRLTKTIYAMEQRGVRVDIDYCKRARHYEIEQGRQASLLFESITGRQYEASPKLFAEVFADQKDKWSYTKKGNASFGAEALSKFSGPIAEQVLRLRDAKSKCDFYSGFLYHADPKGFIHPNYNPDGAGHGRFSSSNPNLQNLTNEEDAVEGTEFLVRRAFIPNNSEFVLDSFDYNAMEYRFMLEQACILLKRTTPLTELVKAGKDVHEATAQLAKEFGVDISRKEAKMSNFLSIYGGGDQALADALKCTVDKAFSIRSAIFKAAPEMKTYMESVIATCRDRGYIVNWLGRRCYFPNKEKAYKAPNYHISGGCADIVKVAMNEIEDYLKPFKTKMSLTVHDELIFNTHKDEADIVRPRIKEIMQTTYKSVYMPLTVGHSFSEKSLGDLN
jgi:DNA polymerase I-like protein with 3'-5' exonuclease and polymerase domains